MTQEKIALKAAADLLYEFLTRSGHDDFSCDDLDDDQWLEIIKMYSAAQADESVVEDITEALASQPHKLVKMLVKTIHDRSDDAQVVKSLSEMLVDYNKEYLSDHIQIIFQERVEREREMGDLNNN